MQTSTMYNMWLQYKIVNENNKDFWREVAVLSNSCIARSIKEELRFALNSMYKIAPDITTNHQAKIVIGVIKEISGLLNGKQKEIIADLPEEGYLITNNQGQLILTGKTDKALLYAVFHVLREVQLGNDVTSLNVVEGPKNILRMVNQWDNLDGSVERGYSGNSIFYENGEIVKDKSRIRDYARFLASVGINAISINNVNVWEEETYFITKKYLPEIKEIADIFKSYGVTLYLSINFASPIAIDGLDTADPLVDKVRKWWKEKVTEIYQYIPYFGGFVVKADSEHRPGPFTYGRDHADGSNMLAEALAPYNGKVIWRCFVYNCVQDWRDRSTDRARAAYDHFKPLDGKFHENVILQIKNGPMDFQVREPVSPLIGAMEHTNQMVEFQIAQEYTGQQRDLCYLIPQWKHVLKFDTHIKGEGTTIEEIVAGNVHSYKYSGLAAVSNIGNDDNWTGNTLAQANLYGYGRLTWNPGLAAETIAKEWIQQTFGKKESVLKTMEEILMDSWHIYENYTAPLGIGWMVTPHSHYGPNIDGYEYSRWGTYHFADRQGIGVDRTIETGTGYTAQYEMPNQLLYNNIDTCPDELLLFFHHVPYKYTLKSGKTVIQHIYDTHFSGYEQVEQLISKWETIKEHIDVPRYKNISERFSMQKRNAKEWRDQINTYFYRKSGIEDEKRRTIY
ncbi:alpha-glucuronidase [Gracilibacillus ureilyticus]|uniref:Xylan alpha-1,2-glucuronidase n=1 Tax=Gracilibacillus ureilyticus TaxID=531814 RepID=A0A1H9PQ11_9BACI|nr:alpha-glucuronidase family glycosyl hydrolase [Gracilibacillus ureilyticus]SER50341.1 alpha-glucuronidase [Gracilibacillus ureilyticus]